MLSLTRLQHVRKTAQIIWLDTSEIQPPLCICTCPLSIQLFSISLHAYSKQGFMCFQLFTVRDVCKISPFFLVNLNGTVTTCGPKKRRKMHVTKMSLKTSRNTIRHIIHLHNWWLHIKTKRKIMLEIYSKIWRHISDVLKSHHWNLIGRNGCVFASFEGSNWDKVSPWCFDLIWFEKRRVSSLIVYVLHNRRPVQPDPCN